jgi:hypothetical protein
MVLVEAFIKSSIPKKITLGQITVVLQILFELLAAGYQPEASG